jgi:prolyl 4-hydroxylase
MIIMMQAVTPEPQRPEPSSKKRGFTSRMAMLFSALWSANPEKKSKAADDFEQFGQDLLQRFVEVIRGGPKPTPGPVSIRVNHAKRVRLNGHEAECDLFCEAPTIYAVRGFLKEGEASELICMALPKLERSLSFTELSEELVNDIRTSTSASIPRDENDLTRDIAHRAAELCGSPVECLEDLHVTRYEPGQHFTPHHDYFLPSLAHLQPTLNNGGQRVRTLLIYLNDLDPGDSGGATNFPQLNLAFKCEQGSGLLWHNVDGYCQPDVMTQHGGVAPKTSTKFVLTVWCRERPIVPAGRPSWQSHKLV